MMRARLVSAVAFAGAVALPGFLLWCVMVGIGATTEVWPLVTLLLYATPAALVGAVAGRWVAAAADLFDVIAIGVAVTVASAFLLALAGALADLVRHGDGGLSEPWLWFYILVVALCVSPLGMLGSYVAWRWIHRGAPSGGPA